MNVGKSVFAHLMSLVPWFEFGNCADKYDGDYKVQKFTTRQQFLVMCLAQMYRRESLHDIESCLNTIPEMRYHAGIRQKVEKFTLGDANEVRDYRIFAKFAQVLISTARELYQTENDFKLEQEKIAFALDSTMIDLCLTLVPWAPFRKRRLCPDLDCCMLVFAPRNHKEALAVGRIIINDISGPGILHFR
jgi:hypothetical protein